MAAASVALLQPPPCGGVHVAASVSSSLFGGDGSAAWACSLTGGSAGQVLGCCVAAPLLIAYLVELRARRVFLALTEEGGEPLQNERELRGRPRRARRRG